MLESKTVTLQKRRISGYLLGRTVVLAALIPVVTAYGMDMGGVMHPSLLAFIVLTVLSFGFTLITATTILRGRAGPRLQKVQPLWDVSYTTALIFVSGGFVSPVVLFYPFTIIGAAMLFFRQGAFIAATWSSLGYALIVLLQVYKVIEPLNPFPVEEIGGMALPFRMAFHFAAFYATAFLAGYLAEELRRADLELQEAKGEIVDLEHFQDAILRSMAGGLAAFTTSGKLMFINDHGERLLRKAGVSTRKNGQLGELFYLDKEGRNEVALKGGETILGYNVVPMLGRSDLEIGRLLSFQDVTEIRKLEENVKANDRLAAIGRLAAGLAHEIRNPLASLSGSVQLIAGKIQGNDEKEMRLLNIVLRETERLNKLVTGFLQYARPSTINRSPFDLSLLIDEIYLFFRQGEGSGVFNLVNDIPKGTLFNGDREVLEQVFLNLFRNSIEASPDGVEVRTFVNTTSDRFELIVSDNGPGISKDLAKNIFEPFVSGRSTGSGLGLALVHRIAENHGGTVVLEESPEGGASFRFQFEME